MTSVMTCAERPDVRLLNLSRRHRIAKGAGVRIEDVAQLVRQFETISTITKQMSNMGALGKIKAMKELQAAGKGAIPGMPSLGGFPGFGGKKSTFTAGPKAKFKKRK